MLGAEIERRGERIVGKRQFAEEARVDLILHVDDRRIAAHRRVGRGEVSNRVFGPPGAPGCAWARSTAWHRGFARKPRALARAELALGVAQRPQIGCFEILAELAVERKSLTLRAGAILTTDDAPAAGEARSAPCIRTCNRSFPFSLVHHSKARSLVGVQAIKSATNHEVTYPVARCIDMEVMDIWANIIVVARPQHVSRRVDYRALTGVVGRRGC